MADPTPARRTALQTFQDRDIMPTWMNSEELSTQLTREIRERAFFSSKVKDVRILQKFYDETEAVLNGEYDEATAIARTRNWLLDEYGYKPEPGKEGGLEDLSSLERLSVIFRTNVDMARGYSAWLHQMQVRRTYPAQRMVRVAERMEPRDWDVRWEAAYAATNETPGAHPTDKVAPIDHPIWTQLSRFSNPYPPFDFNSGMGVKPVGREEAQKLELLPIPKPKEPAPKGSPDNPIPLPSPGADREPAAPVPSFNETAEASLEEINRPELREQLSKDLGGLARIDGNRILMTDPNGTRPMTAAALKAVWDSPMPEGFTDLPQRAALDRWDGGRTEVSPDDSFHLLRLFSRIETLDAPGSVWRVFSASAEWLAQLAIGVAIAIPAAIIGWAFAEDKAATHDDIEAPEGWSVSMKVTPSGKAIDVRDIRPGKPGFVYVGGLAFIIERMERDEENKRVTLTVREA
ncbi:MAG: hypothetical protein QM755_23735 [Luteolibacter sp.]